MFHFFLQMSLIKGFKKRNAGRSELSFSITDRVNLHSQYWNLLTLILYSSLFDFFL